MTPKQVALVQDSFAKVALISEAAAVLFYDRLFDIAPQTKAMFPDDMIEQRRKLMTMLAGVVKGLDNLEQVLPAASALAKRHVSYGAKAEHYPVVGAALLWTLENVRECKRVSARRGERGSSRGQREAGAGRG